LKTADYYGGESLELGGAIRLGEQIVFVVSAPAQHRYYWRSRVFDIYEGGRWSPAVEKRLNTPSSLLEINYSPDSLGARELVRQEFTMGLNASRLVYAAPQPFQVNLPTRTDLRYVGPDEETRWMNISVIRPTRVLYRGDTYTATSLVSTATAPQLRGASTLYPDWVRQIYIDAALPITERTAQLAREIVNQAGASTPYDQARAVETWLRTNIAYNEAIPQPPPDQDQVDWFLFDLRQGYCEYYASAMIVMVRSLGIPARMAAGFSQGTWDTDSQRFVVKERDAHTWVEVFFPGYGWIEFEPTSAQAPINRVGDEQSPPQPTPQPLASPTPTATFTPTEPANLRSRTCPPTIAYPHQPPTAPVIVPTHHRPSGPQPRGFSSLPRWGWLYWCSS
jgi:transglutaminase-like putative cysteine protease